MPQKHIPDDPNVKRGVLLLLVYITIHNYKGFVNHAQNNNVVML